MISQNHFGTAPFLHAGKERKGRSQRARGGKLPAGSVETPKSAEKWEEKCTPVRRGSAGVSVQEEANCTPAASRRPYRRRYGMKMHAGEARKCRGQRARGGKLYAVSVETSKPAEKRDKKCTPLGEEGQRPAYTRGQNPRRQRRNVQAGGETR